jgi:hypothetical protein
MATIRGISDVGASGATCGISGATCGISGATCGISDVGASETTTAVEFIV